VPGLGGFAHHVLAVRLLAGATNGPLGTLFSVGGATPQGVNVFFPLSLTAARAFPLRGYADGEVRGVAGDVTLGYDFPLSVRLGVAEPLANPPTGVARRLQVYAALSSDF
jgi:hypothetical protein